MLQLKNQPVSTERFAPFASAEDLEQAFAKQRTDLFRLALQLTADAEKAESCVLLAMRDCLLMSRVSMDQVDKCARRMVIRHAIRLVWQMPDDIRAESGFEFYLQPSRFSLEGLRESIAILSLPDLDRLAFVICVLERHSILDCAFLLRKAPQEVHDAIVRAARRVLPREERRLYEAGGAIAGKMYGTFWGEGNEGDGSGGSIFD